ncbi:porin, partial [Aureimonas jatrophae]
VRARINFDAREETELGTLRAFVRLQATNTSGANNGVAIDQAYLQLGGLLMGYRDTLWSSGIGGLEDGLLTDTDLVVGDFSTNQVNYTFALGGFSATIGLEDDNTGDVVPDVHAKLVYSGAWGGAYLSAVYDETFNQNNVTAAFGTTNFAFGNTFFVPTLGNSPTLLQDGNNDAFALKGGVLLKDLLAAESQLKIEGHYAFDPTVYSVITGIATTGTFAANNPNINNPTPGSFPLFLEWAAGAGYAQGFGKLGIAVSGQYGETFETTFATLRQLPNGQFLPGTIVGEGEYYAFVGNIGYAITPNFKSLAEVSYRNVEFDGLGDEDQVSGFLRFQREF